MIYDFKKIQTNTSYNRMRNSAGDKILWVKIRQVRACKDTPYVLFTIMNFDDDAVEYYININFIKSFT